MLPKDARNQRQNLEETRLYMMSYDGEEKRLVVNDRESPSEHNIWDKAGFGKAYV